MPDGEGAQTGTGTSESPNPGGAPGTGTGGTGAGQQAQQQQQTGAISLTREELDRQLADVRRATERELKNSADYKAAQDALKKLKDIEDQQKSETEKLTERATKAEQLADERAKRYKAALIKADFVAQASAEGVPADRIDDAYQLAALDGVTVDEENDRVSGVDKAVVQLLKDKPWLVGADGKRAAPNVAGGQGTPPTRAQIVEQQYQEAKASGRYRRIF